MTATLQREAFLTKLWGHLPRVTRKVVVFQHSYDGPYEAVKDNTGTHVAKLIRVELRSVTPNGSRCATMWREKKHRLVFRQRIGILSFRIQFHNLRDYGASDDNGGLAPGLANLKRQCRQLNGRSTILRPYYPNAPVAQRQRQRT